MEQVFNVWVPDYAVSLVRDYVVPCVGGGFVLGAIGWHVGFVVDGLFAAMAGTFDL